MTDQPVTYAVSKQGTGDYLDINLVATGITAAEVHRRLPRRHNRRDDPRERAILARGELSPARACRVEWLDLCGHDLSLLPLHCGCLAHVLDRVTRWTRGGPHSSP